MLLATKFRVRMIDLGAGDNKMDAVGEWKGRNKKDRKVQYSMEFEVEYPFLRFDGVVF